MGKKFLFNCFVLICLSVLSVVCLLPGCTGTPPKTASRQAAVQEKSKNLPDEDIILIVNGDDVGINEIFTDATFEAYFSGKISSASIIPGGLDADRAISILKKHPGFEIGIHLSLTGDWKPLTPKETAPSLYSNAGTMWSSDQEARRNVKPEHAKMEWEAQINKIKDAGIKISHMDSHMSSYFLSPELFTAAFELSRKYRIPLIASYNSIGAEEWRKYFPLLSYSGIYRLQGGYEETLENRENAYWNKFRNYKPGIHYLFTHQGRLPEGGELSGDLDLRVNEYKFWTNEETKNKLMDMGISVKPFSALREEFKNILNAPG